MKKQLILSLAMAAVAVTACGKKDSYKAAKTQREIVKPSPADTNEVAAAPVEEKAEQNILADEHHQMYRKSSLSVLMKQEILGVSAKIEKNADKANIEVTLLDSRSEECKEKTFRKDNVLFSSLKQLTAIDGLGRIRCVENDCINVLLLVEDRRSLENEEWGGSTMINGTVAILLKKDESGVYKPLTTGSEDFLQVNNATVAIEACKDVMSRLQNRPQTGDEFAQERERNRQESRMTEIDTRLGEISTRLDALKSGSVRRTLDEIAQEIQRLTEEKTRLEAERQQILDGRARQEEVRNPTPLQPAVEAETGHVPVDPTLEE